jgi:hypothetical protein
MRVCQRDPGGGRSTLAIHMALARTMMMATPLASTSARMIIQSGTELLGAVGEWATEILNLDQLTVEGFRTSALRSHAVRLGRPVKAQENEFLGAFHLGGYRAHAAAMEVHQNVHPSAVSEV